MTVTIQKELADRIAAAPGIKDYGALSVWMQSQCRVELVRQLPPTVFWPRPKVTSAIIQIDARPAVARPDRRPGRSFTISSRSLFFHRRKFLRSVLHSAWKNRLDKPAVDGILADCELEPRNCRAEQLDVRRRSWPSAEAVRAARRTAKMR